MFLDLEPVFNNIGARLPFAYAFVPADSGISESVEVSGAVENRAGIVTLSASVSFTHETVCDRCLKPLRVPFQKQFSHVLVQTLADEDDDEFIEVQDLHFDLDSLVREDILLALEPKTLCKPDCKGLCPMCGADLNETACSCKKAVDPRLAVLQQLLTDEIS